MTRINIYDRTEYSDGGLLGWFTLEACTERIDEDTAWDGNNHRGVLSGLQCGSEELLRTKQGRWVRHYDSTREYNGPEYHEFLTDAQARAWLLKNNTEESEAIIERYFGEVEEETGPSAGGRPKVGPTINVAYPAELLEKIDEAAAQADLSRAAWLRKVAENAVTAVGV